ncbi:MAG: hypothetical protein ACRCY9_21650 [Phycicoccus sp.]
MGEPEDDPHLMTCGPWNPRGGVPGVPTTAVPGAPAELAGVLPHRGSPV